jgi:hypothetical protein
MCQGESGMGCGIANGFEEQNGCNSSVLFETQGHQ